MKNQKLFLIKFLLSFFVFIGFTFKASAHDNFLGHAPDRGVIVFVTSNKIAAKSGDKVKFEGTIQVTNKGNSGSGNAGNEGLLEEFKKQGIEILASFPNSTSDVTASLNIYSQNHKEIRFSYESSELSASDLNQFSIKVFNNHQDKEMLKRLAKIEAKIQKRVLALEKLKASDKNINYLTEKLASVQKQIDKLSAIAQKISQRLNENEDLIAENTYAQLVDNQRSAMSRISTVMNKFRFVIESSVGSPIEGMSSKISVAVSNLRNASEDSSDSFYNPDDLNIVDLIFNDVLVKSISAQKIRGGESVSFDYETSRLNPINKNLVSLILYRAEDSVRNKRIGYVSQVISVAKDLVNPIWGSANTPNLAYVKFMESIFLEVSDSFGRIDPDSLLVSLQGDTLTNQSYSKDLTSLLSKIKLADGESYEFRGSAEQLEEGTYSFKAVIKDLAGNFADPNPYQRDFRIDRTKPEVYLGLANGHLTNKFSVNLPASSDLKLVQV